MKKKSSSTSFYDKYKVLIWLLIIVIAVIIIMKYISDNKNNKVDPVQNDIVIVIEPKNNVEVGKDNSIKLNATINVAGASLYWTSSNTSVATVENGNVTGVNYGSATITVSYIDNVGIKHSDNCVVTVIKNNSDIELKSVNFPEGDLYLKTEGTYKLNLVLSPVNATINGKTFVSNNEKVVKVSSDGLVEAVGEGHTTIKAIVNGEFQTTIDVYVSSSVNTSGIIISPNLISFDISARKLKVGNVEVLNYSLLPSNANRDNLTWISADPSIVSVDKNGVIMAKKEGTTRIVLSGVNGVKDSVLVEVASDVIPVQDIVVSNNNLNMEAGRTETITPVVIPSNASNQGLTYESVDPSVVSVSVNGSGTSAVLSALKKGNTTVIIKSGNIEKRINVNVTGNGNNSQIDEDGIDLPTTIKVTSNKNNLAKSYAEVKNIPVPGATNIKITLAMGVGKIKYCYSKYGNSLCTPNIEQRADTSFLVPSGAIYVLRVIKYDYNDNEISSTSPNYIDGVLNYYINTESSTNLYTVTGAYDNATEAKLSPVKTGKVTIKLTDTSRHLYICYKANGTCTPSTRVYSSYVITTEEAGLTRIYIDEYDNDNNKIGNTEIYYVWVSNDSTNTVDIGTNPVVSSDLSISKQNSIGNYLSVKVESSLDINNIRFCYKIVNKGTTGTCNLNRTATSVLKHDGTNFFHPMEEGKTYYGSFIATNMRNFWFDLDALDDFFDNNITNKDVIVEYSVKSSMGYSAPIKVRINMASKTGTTAKWNTSFIK